MNEYAAATLRSLAFLTRLPPFGKAFTGPHRLGEDAYAFPLAGLLATIPAALVLLVGDELALPSLVAATLAVAAQVFVTGALHEDGLGDVADGLGGHHERDRALAIMKDSRVGSYGALALILSAALRIGLVAGLVDATGAGDAALLLVAVAAVSRGAMAWLWSTLPTADPGGLADKVGQPSKATGRVALIVGDLIYLIAGFAIVGIGPTVAGFALAGLTLLLFRRFIERRLGGQTGDCLGAAQQLVEISALLGLSMQLG